MVLENLKTVQEIAFLIRLTVPGLGVKRYQNACREDYFFLGEPYCWLDFDGAPLGVRRLDFSNTESFIEIGNASARHDAIAPVRSWLLAHDGWRRGEVEIFLIAPNDPTVPIVENRLTILASDLEGGKATIRLRSPIEAINAVVTSVSLTRQNVPELPYSESQHTF